jgi:hypothetical protein
VELQKLRERLRLMIRMQWTLPVSRQRRDLIAGSILVNTENPHFYWGKDRQKLLNAATGIAYEPNAPFYSALNWTEVGRKRGRPPLSLGD